MSGIAVVVVADNSSAKKAAAVPGLPPKFRISKNFSLFRYTISAQPDQDHLAQLFATIRQTCSGLDKPYRIRVVDLRDEQHCFVNGQSVAWLDPDSNLDLELFLHANELSRTQINFLQERKSADKPELIDLHSIVNERNVLAAFDEGVEYRNMPIVNHGIPGAQFIDQLIANFHADKKQPHYVITHFHCKGGNTRSAFAAALNVLMTLKEHGLIDQTKGVETHLKEHLDEKSFSRLYPLSSTPLERESSVVSIRSNRSSTLSFSSIKTDEDGSSMERIIARAEKLDQIFDYILDDKNGFSAGNNWTQWHELEAVDISELAITKSDQPHPFLF